MHAFKEEFNKVALELFGSGWLWLVLTKDLELIIRSSSNAENPLPAGNIPIFVLDVWEHAYYLDYRSSRKNYVENIWQMVNWSFMENELLRAGKFQKNRRKYQEFFPAPNWPTVSPSFLLRRKSSIRGGAIIGAAIGMVLFVFLSILVDVQIIPLPGLVTASCSSQTGLTLVLGAILGAILGAAIGTLVGIGIPVPLSNGPVEKG